MEYHNNILCVTGGELILSEENPKGVVTIFNYKNLVNRGRIKVLRRACYGTPALIDFYSIPIQYRETWISKNGDPNQKAKENKFLAAYEFDAAAEDYFKTYTFIYNDNEKRLSDEKIREYTNNASILNAIKKVREKMSTNRRALGMKRFVDFWGSAASLLEAFSKKGITHSLPDNSRRLQDKFSKYVQDGYLSLIHKNYMNSAAVKINEEAGEWILAQWMSVIERVTMAQLFKRYNSVAKENGWKPLKTEQTLRDWLYRPDIEVIWHAARHGELSAKEKYSKQNRTKMPTMRDSLWYGDGTKLNYFYRDEAGNVHTCQVYEVIDVYSECFLGYHISKSENHEAQYHAYKMALTKAGQRPYEIKYDNQGGHKKLEGGDFLKRLARISRVTSPYNGKSKTIESAFGRFQADYLHQDWFFTGQNVTATKKESKTNMEFILANLSNLKTLDEIKELYRQRREEWNAAPHPKTGIARAEMYRTSVNAECIKVGITDMIEIFGVTTTDARQYLASGIVLEVGKKKHAYEVLTTDGDIDMAWHRRNVGRTFYRRYCPDDMSMIGLYVKDSTGMRLVTIAQEYDIVQRNTQEQTHGDLVRIRTLQNLNKEQRIAGELERSAILEKHGLHPNQHGLNVAPLKGITSGKKQKKDIGQHLKEVSNADDAAIEKARRKAARDSVKKEQQAEQQRADDRAEFLRRKRELELMSMN